MFAAQDRFLTPKASLTYTKQGVLLAIFLSELSLCLPQQALPVRQIFHICGNNRPYLSMLCRAVKRTSALVRHVYVCSITDTDSILHKSGAGTPVYGLPERPGLRVLRHAFEHAKCRENEAVEAAWLRGPAGLRHEAALHAEAAKHTAEAAHAQELTLVGPACLARLQNTVSARVFPLLHCCRHMQPHYVSALPGPARQVLDSSGACARAAGSGRCAVPEASDRADVPGQPAAGLVAGGPRCVPRGCTRTGRPPMHNMQATYASQLSHVSCMWLLRPRYSSMGGSLAFFAGGLCTQACDAVKAVVQAAGYCTARYAARIAFEAAHAGSLSNPKERCAYAFNAVSLV